MNQNELCSNIYFKHFTTFSFFFYASSSIILIPQYNLLRYKFCFHPFHILGFKVKLSKRRTPKPLHQRCVHYNLKERLLLLQQPSQLRKWYFEQFDVLWRRLKKNSIKAILNLNFWGWFVYLHSNCNCIFYCIFFLYIIF